MSPSPRFDAGLVVPSGPVLVEPQLAGDLLVAKAEMAEAFGYRWFGVGEHVFFHDQTRTWNGFTALAYVAARVSRIELLSTITIVPLYSAGLLAKMACSLDVLCGGRFNLGVGLGGEFAAEFAACGVPVGERGARTDESLRMFRSLMTGEQVDIDGRFAQVHGRMNPPPVRMPPIWIGGRGPASIARAARLGDVWMPLLMTAGQLNEGVGRLAAEVEAVGRPAGGVRAIPMCFTSAGPDGKRAVAEGVEFLSELYQQEIGPSYLIAGDAEQCARQLRNLRERGCAGAMIAPACRAETFDEMAKFVSQEVLSRV
jgi:alkanesulfonate monooxygenase SsuD/methylene tetrahydromethanopterin reductase-like flavin-dependent oxidoreductase (luciferase family)